MEGGRGAIALHGVRQKRENFIKPKRGFCFRCRMLAVLLFLLTAVTPLSGPTVFPAYDGQAPGALAEEDEFWSAPDLTEQAQQTLVRERTFSGSAGFLRQHVTFRYRHLQQIRLFVWCMVTGFLLPAAMIFVHCGVIRCRQKELVWRRLWIIRHRNRADGKKERIALSIKRKHDFYEREDERNGYYYLDYDDRRRSSRSVIYCLPCTGNAGHSCMEGIPQGKIQDCAV